jgi:hypothetical protein
LPARGSHRPERAQLTHSVPQVTPSLRQRRTVAANPLVAIRWPCVDTPWQVRTSQVFPSSGLVTRRPASLPRVLDGASSPASAVLSGRYDFLPSIPPRFVSFAWRYHPSARVSPARGRALPRAGLLELVTRYLRPGKRQWKRQDLLRSWGTPMVLLPCSSTPVGPTHQAMQCVGAAPAVSTTKAPAFVLSRLNHTASALAVYASQAGSPRHHARLASGCWPSSSGRA